MPQPLRALGFLAAAVFCFSAFVVGSEWAGGYLIQYLTHAPAPGEVSLELNLLLFVLPATAFAAAAIGEIEPVARRLVAAFDALAGGSRRWRSWPVVLALVVLGLAVGFRATILREAPVTDDENAYTFQAQLLASGRLSAASAPEPVRAFFDNQFIVNNGRWFGMYFIGHPVVLALARALGFGQWTGPIMAALTLLLAVGIARRLLGDRVAALTGILLALSPFFIFLSATQLSQPTSAFVLTLSWYALVRMDSAPSATRWWALAAAAMAFGVLTRPQAAVPLSLPFLARLTLGLARGRLRPGWRPVIVSAAVAGVGAAVFLGVNHALTGHVLQSGYQVYWAQVTGWIYPAGPYYTIREISQDLALVNFWLFGWPLSLVFVPFFHRTGATWALAAIPPVALLWYGLLAVPTVAPVGPVYYGETIVPLAILSASGLDRAVAFARARVGDAWASRALVAWPATAVAAALLSFVPVQIASLRLSVDLARAPYDLVEQRGLDHAVVFVRSIPSQLRRPGSWVHSLRNNSPDLSDRVLFVKDLGAEKNEQLMRYLPGRTPYLMGMQGEALALAPLRPPG